MEFYGQNLVPLKANLHTHSTVSDGIFTLEKLIELYSGAGYDILAFTDHRKANRVSNLDGKGMTLLSGIELHPVGPRGITWHFLALGVPEDFTDCSELAPQDIVDRVNQSGAVCFVAHPYWCGLTSAEVMSLTGILGIEVYNASTRYIGKEYNMQMWDETLDAGKNYTVLAVDDVHREAELFMGWTMIACSERSQEKILEAIRTGQFYSTEGPEFKKLSFKDGIFEAEFTPCSKAVIITNQCCGFGIFDDGGNDARTSIRFDESTLKPGSYLRCQICYKDCKYAWTNTLLA